MSPPRPLRLDRHPTCLCSIQNSSSIIHHLSLLPADSGPTTLSNQPSSKGHGWKSSRYAKTRSMGCSELQCTNKHQPSCKTAANIRPSSSAAQALASYNALHYFATNEGFHLNDGFNTRLQCLCSTINLETALTMARLKLSCYFKEHIMRLSCIQSEIRTFRAKSGPFWAKSGPFL